MKLTWFGGTALRIHIGGKILAMDAPPGAGEMVSGADLLFGSDDALPDGAAWRPRPAGRLIDGADPGVAMLRLGAAILVDAPGEPPLVIGQPPLPLARWGAGAVVVLFTVQEPPPVRLIALALVEVDTAMARMAPLLDGTGLVALERGLALEV